MVLEQTEVLVLEDSQTQVLEAVLRKAIAEALLDTEIMVLAEEMEELAAVEEQVQQHQVMLQPQMGK